MIFKSIYPFDQSVIAEYQLMSETVVHEKLNSAKRAFVEWSTSSFSERATLFRKLSSVLQQEKERLAQLMTFEMGKAITEARAEIEKCAMGCQYYVDHGENILKRELLTSDPFTSYAVFQPVGAVFAVMPWNFPFWQVFRYAVPTLLAGNVTLLKHAPNVCGCSLAIEEVFKMAGFPEGVFQSLIIDVSLVEKIISSDVVQGVTLTGSEAAGASVAALSGKHIKKTVLELGGSDPFIVLADADLELAAKIAVQSRMQNAGQSCIAAKRFIVTESVKEEFVQKVLEHVSTIKQGNPMLQETTMGPVARKDLAEKTFFQYQKTVAQGAKAFHGGEVEGCNVQPIVIVDVPLSSPAFVEETFGPLMPIVSVKNDQEAVLLANQTRYGLGASIWTKEAERGQKMALEIHSGAVFINSMMKSDPTLPFGGVKKSGYGRELSYFGMREFLNIKTIVVG